MTPDAGNSKTKPIRMSLFSMSAAADFSWVSRCTRPRDTGHGTQRLPILKDFYRRCCTSQIPIMNHCTPDGGYTFDRERVLRHSAIPTIPRSDTLESRCKGVHAEDRDFVDSGKYPYRYIENAKEDFFSESDRYFNYKFVAPKAWEEVLQQEVNGDKLNTLRLCLAHFGGNTKAGRRWGLQIIDLIKDYDNVYTDLCVYICRKRVPGLFQGMHIHGQRLRTRSAIASCSARTGT